MYMIHANVPLKEMQAMPGLPLKAAEAHDLQPDDISVMATDESGQPIGSLLLKPDKRAGEKVASYSVALLQVSPEHRKQGLECTLLKEAGRQAARKGARRIHLCVKPGNCEMVDICEDLGKAEGVAFVLCLEHGGL